MSLNIKDNVSFSQMATELQQTSIQSVQPVQQVEQVEAKSKTIETASQVEQANDLDKTLLQQQQQAQEEKNKTKEQLQNWVKVMNKTINEKVRFSYSEDFGGIYVTVVDSKTQEIIRKIPSDEAIKLSAIWKEAVGNILDKRS
jgi:flagellar protein FlaG